MFLNTICIFSRLIIFFFEFCETFRIKKKYKREVIDIFI